MDKRITFFSPNLLTETLMKRLQVLAAYRVKDDPYPYMTGFLNAFLKNLENSHPDIKPQIQKILNYVETQIEKEKA